MLRSIANRTRVLLVVMIALLLSAESGAFVRDTHYYLTFGLALSTCFDWDEAWKVASGDVMIDQNPSTRAEKSLAKKKQKQAWHGFGHSGEHFNAAWQRALDERNPGLKLMKFGQFLHFAQDWEAHAGYPLSSGHALATITGRDPDSLAKNEARTDRMVQTTLDHMAKMCAVLDRLPHGVDDPDFALMAAVEQTGKTTVIQDLVKASSTKWRTGLSGGLNKKGWKILSANKERVEQFIDEHLRDAPERKIPEEFKPGDPTRGIPPPLQLHFTPAGELIAELGVTIEHAVALGAKKPKQWDNEVRLEHAVEVQGGWEVRFHVKNTGKAASPPGEVQLIVVDPLRDEQIGERLESVPGLPPRNEMMVEAIIPTSRSSKNVLIGVFAAVDDLSNLNNELWFMTEKDSATVQQEWIQQGRSEDGREKVPPIGSIGFARPPRMKMLETELCFVILARTDLNDPTESFAPPTITLIDAEGRRSTLRGSYPRVWSITTTEPGSRPAAKSFECVELVDELCGRADWGTRSAAKIEVSLRADDIVSAALLELDTSMLDQLAAACPPGPPRP